MARQTRRLVEEKGIMTSPNPRQGRTLPAEVAEKKVYFFCRDEISRLMPGKKDYVTIREGGEKKQVQKRFILCSLKEAYSVFKKAGANLKIGFSKSAALRPKNCVLPGAPGTRSVCVCIHPAKYEAYD